MNWLTINENTTNTVKHNNTVNKKIYEWNKKLKHRNKHLMGMLFLHNIQTYKICLNVGQHHMGRKERKTYIHTFKYVT